MKIDLRNLREGENEFTFEETPEQLHIHNPELSFIGPITTRLMVFKFGDALMAKGETRCTLRPDCARCLEPIELPICASYTFVFQKGKHVEEDADETLIWIGDEQGEIDLGEEVKDYILLELPMIPTCQALPSGPCPRYDQDINSLLDHSQETDIDPRWEALRALKKQKP